MIYFELFLIDKLAACLLCLNIETSLIAMIFLELLFVVTVISYCSSFLVVPIADRYLSDGLGLNVYPVFSLVNFIV